MEQTTQSIHNHEESIVTATTGTATATPVAMPRYVNVDGIMSIDNGNSSSNNNNQCNDNENDSDNYFLFLTTPSYYSCNSVVNGHGWCISLIITCCNMLL